MCFPPPPLLRSGAHEIALADFYAVVAQNVVGSGDMEIEVRQREIDEIVLARQRQRLAADREIDGTRFAAVDLFGLEA